MVSHPIISAAAEVVGVLFLFCQNYRDGRFRFIIAHNGTVNSQFNIYRRPRICIKLTFRHYATFLRPPTLTRVNGMQSLNYRRTSDSESFLKVFQYSLTDNGGGFLQSSNFVQEIFIFISIRGFP